MGVSIAKAPIREAILPKMEILQKTANIADKHCIICLKQRLDYFGLQMHYTLAHDGLDIDAPFEELLPLR